MQLDAIVRARKELAPRGPRVRLHADAPAWVLSPGAFECPRSSSSRRRFLRCEGRVGGSRHGHGRCALSGPWGELATDSRVAHRPTKPLTCRPSSLAGWAATEHWVTVA